MPESESSLRYKESLSALDILLVSADYDDEIENYPSANIITLSGSEEAWLFAESEFSDAEGGHPDLGVPRIYEWHFSGDTEAFAIDMDEKDATVKINGEITENKTLYVYCTLTYREKTVRSQNVTITAVPGSEEEIDENETVSTEETDVDEDTSEDVTTVVTAALTSESADENEEVSEEEETTEEDSAADETAAEVNEVIEETAFETEEEAEEVNSADGSEAGKESESEELEENAEKEMERNFV